MIKDDQQVVGGDEAELIAQRMEAAISSYVWVRYITQTKHDDYPVGTECWVRFRTVDDKLVVTVRFAWASRRRSRMRHPKAHYWYFPGLEDVEIAKRNRDRPKLRHTKAPMRPY